MSVWVLLLAILSCAYANSEVEYKQPQCESSSLKVVLRSHYNKTGSWHSQVTIKQDVQLLSPDEETPGHWLTDVKQTSSVCGEGKSSLETIIYLTAPALNPGQQTHSVNTPLHPQSSAPEKYQLAPNTPKPQVVPPGYELYPGVGYYKFHHVVTTWPTARDICAQEGGHLVIINSSAEREVVKTLFAVLNPNSPGSSNFNQIHAGLKFIAQGKYATIFGVPIQDTGFSEWYAGEPSSGASEPCVSIMVQNISYNDISCSKQILAYICEIEIE